MLAWAIAPLPARRERTAERRRPRPRTTSIANFSYRCAPYAGPGYFLVGDAAAFVDPIFSTGVCLGMMSAAEAARGIAAILRGTERAEAVRRRYVRFVRDSSASSSA